MFNLPYHCKALLTIKQEKGLTFDDVAKAINKPEVWTTALFYGQASTDESTADAILNALGGEQFWTDYNDRLERDQEKIDIKRVLNGLSGKGEENMGVKGMITRGATFEVPPKDPVLYRLYEVLVVYGYSYKALIYEKFGDGIMSAIDFRTSLERKKDPKGDRVVITMDGKASLSPQCSLNPNNIILSVSSLL
ncbi:cyanate hydratase [Cryptococcus neoformans C23]|uniref:Cyanate hydratase n=1 Tax=Cryptococcus neoformans Tu259-1 TaxID=1230072 RepID=A0A854QKK1_CRYNE|nr:cyanate hydratase [Cryptococcus neoformans var. grubii C23]OWZ45079.1 cyanate hydratase [Cryptococcus neoformans var. grubii AD1-83a]OWZ58379.1 cyanate hydratase [Cryptococcus neoformans var. grubii 125.91]OWZ70686.1 cyanate hydratase [Cryptococcus neoformans var. grubii]OXC85061.1 cyanate hydratase [Cryptococcus neoformans var. grubii AD1-7a]OXG22443.1 cyanate hydratase [Cryptococcus neoformans var. grubii Tu259-1]OXG33631.1 cyanate hydratase [Cryptococcus neoformans var. grubii Bt15]OXG